MHEFCINLRRLYGDSRKFLLLGEPWGGGGVRTGRSGEQEFAGRRVETPLQPRDGPWACSVSRGPREQAGWQGPGSSSPGLCPSEAVSSCP